MKKNITIFIVLLLNFCSNIFADEVVTLTVNGQGMTKELATANALRSAIEQTFGVFVSSNTQILNDDLVKDEIATVSSGNIQEYKEMSCVNMPNGEVSVTLSAVVSINKLVTYAKSHGSSAELDGQTFAMNLKMKTLNEENELKSLRHAESLLWELVPYMFDFKLIVSDPVMQGDMVGVPMSVTLVSNEASDAFYNTVIGTLSSLSLTDDELKEYQKSNFPYYSIKIPTEYVEIYGDKVLDDWQIQMCYKEYNLRSIYIYSFVLSIEEMIRVAETSYQIKEVGNIVRPCSFVYENKTWYSSPPNLKDSRVCGVYDDVSIAKKELREDKTYCSYAYNLSLPNSIQTKWAEQYEGDIWAFFLDCRDGEVRLLNNHRKLICQKSRHIRGERLNAIISNYTIRIKKSKKQPTPQIITKNIVTHDVGMIYIPSDKIGEVKGFEVVRTQINK